MTSSPTARSARPVVADDRSAVKALAQLSGLFTDDDLEEVVALLDSHLAGTANDDRWWIAVDKTPVAVGYAAPERLTRGTWNLHLLAVHPDHRGHAHGASLVRQVEHDLRQAGAHMLIIDTSGTPDFAPQRRFYSGLGYDEEARIRDFYAPGDDKVTYRLRLDVATL